jgi:hypothetical protein
MGKSNTRRYRDLFDGLSEFTMRGNKIRTNIAVSCTLRSALWWRFDVELMKSGHEAIYVKRRQQN